MTKKDLSIAIHEKTGFSKSESAQMVNFFFKTITDGLMAGEEVKLPKFGSFHVKQRKARTGRNPSTGETVHIPSRTTVVFKPSRFLRNAIDGKEK